MGILLQHTSIVQKPVVQCVETTSFDFLPFVGVDFAFGGLDWLIRFLLSIEKAGWILIHVQRVFRTKVQREKREREKRSRHHLSDGRRNKSHTK